MYNQSQKSEKIFLVDPPPPCAFENGALCSIQEPFFLLSSKYLDSLFLPIYTPHQKNKKNISGVENVYKKILILKGTQKDRGG